MISDSSARTVAWLGTIRPRLLSLGSFEDLLVPVWTNCEETPSALSAFHSARSAPQTRRPCTVVQSQESTWVTRVAAGRNRAGLEGVEYARLRVIRGSQNGR